MSLNPNGRSRLAYGKRWPLLSAVLSSPQGVSARDNGQLPSPLTPTVREAPEHFAVTREALSDLLKRILAERSGHVASKADELESFAGPSTGQ